MRTISAFHPRSSGDADSLHHCRQRRPRRRPLKREPKAGGAPSSAASTAKKDGASRYVTPFRAPTVPQEAGKGKDLIRLENYDDQDFGYLRIVVTQKQMRIEYHPAPDGDAAKTPDDVVAVDLKTRTLVAPQV
jgi:hypothetical protein